MIVLTLEAGTRASSLQGKPPRTNIGPAGDVCLRPHVFVPASVLIQSLAFKTSNLASYRHGADSPFVLYPFSSLSPILNILDLRLLAAVIHHWS
jgi:hypothetical protein